MQDLPNYYAKLSANALECTYHSIRNTRHHSKIEDKTIRKYAMAMLTILKPSTTASSITSIKDLLHEILQEISPEGQRSFTKERYNPLGKNKNQLEELTQTALNLEKALDAFNLAN